MNFSRWPDVNLYAIWDDATMADMARLHSYLNVRLSRGGIEDDGSCLLSVSDVSLVTRTRHTTRAIRRLLSLPKRSGVSLVCQQCVSGVRVSWPKFYSYQTANLKVTKIGIGSATRAGASLLLTNPIQTNPSRSGAGENGGGVPVAEINPIVWRLVEKFKTELRSLEARAHLKPTDVCHLDEERLRFIGVSIRDEDPERWKARAGHALQSRLNRGSGDCGWIWGGRDIDAAALRFSQLASGPVWLEPAKRDDPYAYKGPNKREKSE